MYVSAKYCPIARHLKNNSDPYLCTAAARIPIVDSLGGMEECPGGASTESFRNVWPFSVTPILWSKSKQYIWLRETASGNIKTLKQMFKIISNVINDVM